MRSRLPSALGLGVLLLAGACSSQPDPAPPTAVRNYGPEGHQYRGGTARGSPDGAPGPTRAPVRETGMRWHERLADAQAEAQSTGRMLLVMSTKPRCGLCDKFKTQTAPAAAEETNRVAVGYIYDITRPEVRQVDEILRANLRGADLMPLVGFLTPDLRFVHGFWGSRTVAQYRADVATAARLNPGRSLALAPRAGATALELASVVNEFGEAEWAVLADVWPQTDPDPIDAITGEPEGLRGQGRLPATPDVRLADAVPPAAPPMPAAPAPRPASPVAVTAPAGSAWSQPAVHAPVAPPMAPVVVAQAPVALPKAPVAPAVAPVQRAAPAVSPAPAPVAATAPGLAAHARLTEARGLIASGQFDDARALLADVQARWPASDEAREASKGTIALYNAKRIATATSGDERDHYLTRARRDLGHTMWSNLFDS